MSDINTANQCPTCLLVFKDSKTRWYHSCSIALCNQDERPNLTVRCSLSGYNEATPIQLYKLCQMTATALPGTLDKPLVIISVKVNQLQS